MRDSKSHLQDKKTPKHLYHLQGSVGLHASKFNKNTFFMALLIDEAPLFTLCENYSF